MKIYYKILQKDLTSICMNDNFPEQYRTQYELEKWNKPRVHGTRLFIFDGLNNAFSFWNCFRAYNPRIYECRARDVAKIKKIASPEFVELFWKYKKLHKKITVACMNLPYGSRSCSELFLLREVK